MKPGLIAFGIMTAVIATTAPARSESGTFIRFGQVEIEQVCNYYTNNYEAFDACVTTNLKTGVEVHYTDDSQRGPSYATDWSFCPLNTLEYVPESPLSDADGYVQPCY